MFFLLVFKVNNIYQFNFLLKQIFPRIFLHSLFMPIHSRTSHFVALFWPPIPFFSISFDLDHKSAHVVAILLSHMVLKSACLFSGRCTWKAGSGSWRSPFRNCWWLHWFSKFHHLSSCFIEAFDRTHVWPSIMVAVVSMWRLRSFTFFGFHNGPGLTCNHLLLVVLAYY